MSSFTGRREESWSLSRAVDALGGAARAAGRPGLVWIAGIGYPTAGVGLGASLTRDWLGGFGGAGPDEISSGNELVLELLLYSGALLPVALVMMRLSVGLARIAPPDIWSQLARTFGNARLRQSWRAGKGLTLATTGMYLMITLMMLAAVVAVAVPIGLLVDRGLEGLGSPARVIAVGLLVVPGLALIATYSLALSVIHQLALQSLAHNRRGVGSALIHAWRIARSDPWATGRTLAVDLLLNVTVFVIGQILATLLMLTCAGQITFFVVTLPLLGFAGVTRAGYWARAYRALGGLSPDDGVPGLREEAIHLP